MISEAIFLEHSGLLLVLRAPHFMLLLLRKSIYLKALDQRNLDFSCSVGKALVPTGLASTVRRLTGEFLWK